MQECNSWEKIIKNLFVSYKSFQNKQVRLVYVMLEIILLWDTKPLGHHTVNHSRSGSVGCMFFLDLNDQVGL